MQGITEVITLLLSIFDKVLDKTPDFDQKKKNQYFKLKKEYEDEKKSINRDDNRVDNLRDKLLLFVETYSKEIFRT